MSDEDFMRLAIGVAREGIGKGQTPFGACIVKAGKVVSCEHNRVWETTDITAHAEIVAIRKACEKLESIDLSGSVIYSTCEPCPMCFSAIHWARISKIVFGARIKDAERAGFSELSISNDSMIELGDSPVVVAGSFLRDECIALFTEWSARKDRKVY